MNVPWRKKVVAQVTAIHDVMTHQQAAQDAAVLLGDADSVLLEAELASLLDHMISTLILGIQAEITLELVRGQPLLQPEERK